MGVAVRIVFFLLRQNVLHRSILFSLIGSGKPIGFSQISMLLLVSTWFIAPEGRRITSQRNALALQVYRDGLLPASALGSLVHAGRGILLRYTAVVCRKFWPVRA